jgi:hypothetical protein
VSHLRCSYYINNLETGAQVGRCFLWVRGLKRWMASVGFRGNNNREVIYSHLQNFVVYKTMLNGLSTESECKHKVPALSILTIFMKLVPHMMPMLCDSPKESPLSNLRIDFHPQHSSIASPSISSLRHRTLFCT